ncbi:hypothetical protein BXZ70DRAFT_364659 [Cristinia sonorae]|uniref:Store-operated calcium entry-associated regulatory factor n=1 Tax=Cristinia sonorae TaxID=1940300 RepID=A0A8K0UJE8_9AGAR|nr:hypothetical protein BXZ70DRAFT_364659 [Cristinia sonorae]
MARVALASIPSLTFYKDTDTISKRGKPIPQLTCIGKPCRLYTPDVVRCVNVGGSGTEVDWRCEADLPEALRLGRIQVSCEGWSGPGDPYVLKGSCALEYRLAQVPDSLRKPESHTRPSRLSRFWRDYVSTDDPGAAVFMILWTCITLFILYNLFKSCFTRPRPSSSSSSSSRPRNNRPGGDGGGGWSSWFPGSPHNPGQGHNNDPPPPYSKSNNDASARNGNATWSPGFWTGATLGGLGTYLWNANNGQLERRRPPPPPPPVAYDWEYERVGRASAFRAPATGFGAGYGGASAYGEDRGEGPSDLGRMRRATGFGGSSVR